MNIRKKRGISPIIATVLLIGVALALAIIIFVWARTFLVERGAKMGEPIESSCEKVNFAVEVYAGEIHIENRGNVPLYGIEVSQVGLGFIREVETFDQSISSGDTVSVDLPTGLSDGAEILIIPIVLGEVGEEKKAFTCDKEYGAKTVVA